MPVRRDLKGLEKRGLFLVGSWPKVSASANHLNIGYLIFFVS